MYPIDSFTTALHSLGQVDYELLEIGRKSGKSQSFIPPPSKDRIPLKAKGHGWRRGCPGNPHPCRE